MGPMGGLASWTPTGTIGETTEADRQGAVWVLGSDVIRHGRSEFDMNRLAEGQDRDSLVKLLLEASISRKEDAMCSNRRRVKFEVDGVSGSTRNGGI